MNNTTVSNCVRRATYIRMSCVLLKIQKEKHTICYGFLSVSFVMITPNLAKLAYCPHTSEGMCKLFGWVFLIPKSNLSLSPLRSSLHKPPRNQRIFLFLILMALRPNADLGILIHEVSRSHTTTQHNR